MDQNGKDDLKTQFVTREGTYRLITLSEYSRPNRVGYQSNQNNPQVRVSLLPAKCNNDSGKASNVTGSVSSSNATTSTNSATSSSAKYLPHQSSSTASTTNAAGISMPNGVSDPLTQIQQSSSDKICFNFGKELYVYSYRGVKKNVDLCKPIDKKLYKGTSPSCHDFNETDAMCDCAPLLVGFTTGQIQLVQPGKREQGRLYNEERLIDKTKVTCLKWLPKSPNLFLASHSSGHLYLYNEELPCTPAAPNYQNFKTGDGYTILTCKSKSTRNPLYKWTFNTENCSINEFCFSPCGSMLAIVSQDGFLRVFQYDTMELLGIARSYFGGFLCVCWSPDSKYIVVGGEDDLVTVWSLNERRVVARGQGHRSWVSVVAFDPFTSYSHCDSPDFSDDDIPISCSDKFKQVQKNASTNDSIENIPLNSRRSTRNSYRDSITTTTEKIGTSYRLGSVGQDTQLCLWDITEDILRQSYEKRHRLGSHDPQSDAKDVKLTKATTTEIDSNYNSKISNFCTKFTISNSTTTSSVSTTIATASANVATTATINTLVNTLNDSGVGISTTITTAAAAAASNCGNTSSDSNKHSNSFNKFNSNSGKATNVMDNCVNTTGNNLSKISSKKRDNGDNKTDVDDQIVSIDGKTAITTTTTTTATSSSTSFTTTTTTATGKGSNSKSSESSMNAFNTLTQRLSNFNFVNDKKSSSSSNSHNHKKSFTFSKSSGNHTGFLHSSNNSNASSGHNKNGNDFNSDSTLKNSKNLNNVVSSYDPMKLIGSASCPRFEECPLLEPLVCKKIAHERLTALIFREDCFLTACQDGFIYTWARPGFSNIPQHNISNSPTGASGGTVV